MNNIFDILFTKQYDALTFMFDSLCIPNMFEYITPMDDIMLYKIATSYDTLREKKKAIDTIMTTRNFKKFASGTNRVVYKPLEDTRFLIKIALDNVALKDNPSEMVNQTKLKPFVCKVFQVSPTGTVATVERVDPIVNRTQYSRVADDIFDIIANKFIGKYVMDDIGTKYFMNWGIRKGFGPVLLDYPYLFEIDEAKLYCNKKFVNTPIPCGGLIDYDEGFNHLYCSRCGKKFFARDIKLENNNKLFIIEGKGEELMNIQLIRNGRVSKEWSTDETEVIIDPEKLNNAPSIQDLGVKIKNYNLKDEFMFNNIINVNEKRNMPIIEQNNNLSNINNLIDINLDNDETNIESDKENEEFNHDIDDENYNESDKENEEPSNEDSKVEPFINHNPPIKELSNEILREHSISNYDKEEYEYKNKNKSKHNKEKYNKVYNDNEYNNNKRNKIKKYKERYNKPFSEWD